MKFAGIVIMVMFALNGFGVTGMTINLVIFLLGTAAILLVGSSLPAVGAAFLAGGLFEALQDQDASQGTVKGLNALGRLVLLVSIVWILIAGILSTIPFAWNIWSFLVISAAAVTGVAVNQYFKILEGKWLAWGMLIYAAVFAVIALLNLWGTGRMVLQSGQEAVSDGVEWTLNKNGERLSTQAAETAAPVKATASNGAPGYLDPIVVSPGTTSPEVANSSTQLQVCHNTRPDYVDREVKLQTGEWIDSSEQAGRTVIAVRVKNNGTTPFTWDVRRQSPQLPC
ncbi:MAG: hypothetical protein RLZZ360_254 [Candidatus Parcubacteria bacterium]